MVVVVVMAWPYYPLEPLDLKDFEAPEKNQVHRRRRCQPRPQHQAHHRQLPPPPHLCADLWTQGTLKG